MSLRDWEHKYFVQADRKDDGRVIVCAIVRIGFDAMRDLYNLVDYRVSTVTGGSAWLYPI